MRKRGEATNTNEIMIEAAIEALPNLEAIAESYEVITVPTASPIRRAVDAVGARVCATPGDEWFVKAYFPDILPYISVSDVADASQKAAAVGSAPALIDSAPDKGVLAFEYLDKNWSWGKLDALQKMPALENQFEARRRFHRGERLSRSRNIFSDIESYFSNAQDLGVNLPEDTGWLLDNIRDAGNAINSSGSDSVPCHRDGASSNVMISSDDHIQLIDFDEAANSDPDHDIGSMLTELCLLDEEFKSGIEHWNGTFDDQLFCRCRLYGVADDFLWGLWGLILFHASPRKEVEFFKYGQWRLLRARMNIHNQAFERWCRNA
jgi:thiamine kinase-like enzyme